MSLGSPFSSYFYNFFCFSNDFFFLNKKKRVSNVGSSTPCHVTEMGNTMCTRNLLGSFLILQSFLCNQLSEAMIEKGVGLGPQQCEPGSNVGASM